MPTAPSMSMVGSVLGRARRQRGRAYVAAVTLVRLGATTVAGVAGGRQAWEAQVVGLELVAPLVVVPEARGRKAPLCTGTNVTTPARFVEAKLNDTMIHRNVDVRQTTV